MRLRVVAGGAGVAVYGVASCTEQWVVSVPMVDIVIHNEAGYYDYPSE